MSGFSASCQAVPRAITLVSLSLLLLLISADSVSAETVILSPVKDNTLYGELDDKSNGSGEYIFSGNTDGAGVRRALLAFDIAGNVPAGVTIETASLVLHVSQTPPGVGAHTFTLHPVLQDWGEGASDAGDPGGGGDGALDNDATWIYRMYNKDNPENSLFWTNPGGDYDAAASANQSVGNNGFYTWTSAQMVVDVQDWLDLPSSNFGWMLLGNEGQLKTARRFDSRENSTPANRPELVLTYGTPATPPDVTLLAPNGTENLLGNHETAITWTADDESGISTIDLYLSYDNGLAYEPVALGLSNTGSHPWFPPNRPTTQAKIKIVATDNTLVSAEDESDAVFTIQAYVPPGAAVPTTLRDFDMPGSQPFEAGQAFDNPANCAQCHGNYDAAVEPYRNWQGSMMAQASIDPIFKANLVIANQDAPDSGDLCLRCHMSRGWLQGRSVPTDGSQMKSADLIGVSCNLCHRMVDPISDPCNPAIDADILAALSNPPSDFGTGMVVVDPENNRRGPFDDVTTGHPVVVSPFHREAALCGTCHDVSNPAFENDGSGNYVANAFDTPAADFSPHTLVPVERTYSEWLHSEYNSPTGVYAPQFGGNRDYVATCQDCHMRDVAGYGCDPASFAVPHRPDLPLHDMTGGSTWLPSLLGSIAPGQVNESALQAGITRAQYMLQNAAELTYLVANDQLKVTVTNNTGHKLPTGYPEGRRVWLNVKFYNAANVLLSESGAYDETTGVLTHDAEVKIYEVEPGMTADVAALAGVPAGPSFHFVLNNKIFSDNRIPPRGFTNAAYAPFGGSPVNYSYADGQYWDDTYYALPPDADSAVVTLYYQSTTKEFIEFLRDENTTDTQGQDLYNLWSANGKAAPDVMTALTIDLNECQFVLRSDANNDCRIDFEDFGILATEWLADCWLDPTDPLCVPK